jgi:predicted  nucleic acid-binding Zn-ribbon protein
MKAASPTEMHADHIAWRSEHATWHDDIRAWEKEADAAIADVEKAKAAIAGQMHVLRTHAAAIRMYEQRFATHEHALAEFEGGNPADALRMNLECAHDAEHTKQDELYVTHERIKKQQHTLMAHCNLLLKALAATADSAAPARHRS